MIDLDLIISNKISMDDYLKEEYFVYFLLDGEEIVYVGKSINYHQRLKAHSKNKKFDSYYLLKCKNEKEMDILEFDFIVKFEPKYNSVLPASEYYFSVNKIKEKLNIGAWDFKRFVKREKVTPIANLSGNLYYDIRKFEGLICK